VSVGSPAVRGGISTSSFSSLREPPLRAGEWHRWARFWFGNL